MSETVLDASAVLALLREEPGAVTVAQALTDGAAISAVSVAEVITKLIEAGGTEHDVRRRLSALTLRIVAFDAEQAYQTGLLRRLTRRAGLSLGDRACLALARQLHLPALTADRLWQQVQVGVNVRLIR